MLKDELHFHLEQQIAENVAAGMSRQEARRAALRTFGNPELISEQARATWSWNWLEQMGSELRYGMRTLGRSPGFALIAIGVMALGIGANAAMFAVIRSVLLNPLPFQDPEHLIALYTYDADATKETRYLPVDGGSFTAWKQAAQGMAELALVLPNGDYNVSAEGGQLPESVGAAWVSANFFSTLGVTPQIGRGFSAADDNPEAEATAVLSYSFWKRRYGGDASAIGRKIWLNARPYTVIGVMPEPMTLLGPYSSGKIEIWTAMGHEATRDLLSTFEDHEFEGVARLAPGVTLAQLLDRLNAVQRRIKAEHPGPAVRGDVSGRPMLDDAVQEYRTPLYVLFAATGCVLLIACLNVASLLVARTAARRRELAIRTALGGGRLRLVRERVLESFLLTACGGTIGLGLAAGSLRWLASARPDMHRAAGIHLDLAVIGCTAGAIVICALFTGMVSATGIDGREMLASLQEVSHNQRGGRSRAGLRRVLLVVEVSLTVVLLVGAGQLLKSYGRLRSTEIGIPVDNVLTMHIGLPGARYKSAVEKVSFFEELLGRVRALPGVESAGLVDRAPGQGWGADFLVSVVEHPRLAKGAGIDMLVRAADPGYFAAVRLPILRGRTFAADEQLKNDRVLLISESAARACFPDEDPIGKHVRIDFTGGEYRVIGIVADVRHAISQPAHATMYMPILGNGYSYGTLVVHSARDVEAQALPIQKVIAAMDHDLPVSDVMTMREALTRATLGSEFDSLLVLGFAVVALVLAAAGLYGVLAYLVTQRTSEIGVRIALGAQRQHVLRMVILDGLRPALAGLMLGLLASAVAVRTIKSMLYGAEPLDPVIFAGVSLTLLVVAALACLAPAWRASRVDPMQALRTE
jgi:putative ABC transport system permease protein